jgi:hypothetical protein
MQLEMIAADDIFMVAGGRCGFREEAEEERVD